MKLAISGAHGRMGTAIAKMAFADETICVQALFEHKDHPDLSKAVHGESVQTDNNALEGCEALIEFTLPAGTLQNLDAAIKHKVPMVIGTTGFDDVGLDKIKEASKYIPIVFASNMSIGVNTLFKMIEIAASKVGTGTIKIEETHHVHKKDAPSGTAKTMDDMLEKGCGKRVKEIESFREGEVIGDHTIIFETDEDVLTISHHAKDRSMFAKGAIVAAKFLQNKEPGLYTMQDVLGFNS